MKLFQRKKQSELPRRRRTSGDRIASDESQVSSDIFRRNRTLTGTTSNRLHSSGSSSDLRSPRVKAHNLASMRRKVFGVLVIVILSAGLLWWLINQFTAIPTVIVTDTTITKSINTDKYAKSIQNYLESNPLGRLQFLLDDRSLSNFVSADLSEVAGVEQRGASGIGQTDFAVTMRKPVAGWSIGDKQYYVDASGVPFEINYYDKPKVQIIDESGIALNEGVAIASNRFLSFVGRVVALSSSSGYTVTEAILPAGTTRQLEVRLQGVGPLVKLSIDRPVAEQVEDMSRAVQYFKDHGQAPQYIDVRVSGKAFYR
ncbi:MAG TPA: hypothetical protein PK265_02695 [Candidatus Saccharibacteria bacterium]|nr:hypothetical protein [Candidatus Saccharibacteria bacterium]